MRSILRDANAKLVPSFGVATSKAFDQRVRVQEQLGQGQGKRYRTSWERAEGSPSLGTSCRGLGTTGNLRTAGIGGKLNPEAQRSQKRESCVEYRALRTRTPFCLGLTVVQQINSIWSGISTKRDTGTMP